MAKGKLPQGFSERLEFAGLTANEKELILEKARKHVSDEKKAEAEESYLKEAIAAERRKDRPQEQFEEVLIDLPGHAFRILIDGVEFLHAFTYRMVRSQAATVREMMQRAWNHEDEIGGANRAFYNKPRNLTLRRGSQAVTNSRLLGV